eukprot:Opistho-1_new@3589
MHFYTHTHTHLVTSDRTVAFAPGYVFATASTSFPSPATIAPPTGTKKFLSVLCTNASTRHAGPAGTSAAAPDAGSDAAPSPLLRCFDCVHARIDRRAVSITCMHLDDCTPYALLTTWGTSRAAHTSPTSTTLSGARGAKQLVVVMTQATREGSPNPSIARAMPSRSVRSSSPSSTHGTISGFRPAAKMALKHDFWSMRDHTTCVADGRALRIASSVRTMAIPVAMGSTTHASALRTPAMRRTSITMHSVRRCTSEDPAALGCTSEMLPLRPMPCPIPKWRRATMDEAMRASLSPTPTLPMKLLLSMRAISCRKCSIDASSHPSSGHRRCERSTLTSVSRDRSDSDAWRTYAGATRPSARRMLASFISWSPHVLCVDT